MLWFRKKTTRRKHAEKGFQSFTLRATARGNKKSEPSIWRRLAVVSVIVLFAAGALTLAAMGVCWLAHELLAGNELFRLDSSKIKVEICGSELKPDLVMEYASLGSCSNIFAINLEKTRRDFLRNVPQAKDISFTRRLPGTLEVRVVERLPLAAIHRNRSVCLGVDSEGVVLKLSPTSTLPVITGHSIRSLRPGISLATNRVMCALALLEKCATPEWSERVRVKSVDVARSDRLVVRLEGGECFDLSWRGMEDGGGESLVALELKLQKMRDLLRAAAAHGRSLEHADLTLDRNIPVHHRTEASRTQTGRQNRGR